MLKSFSKRKLREKYFHFLINLLYFTTNDLKKMKIHDNIKRFLLSVTSLFMTLWSFAQTQYDYYEGKDAYGGVDTAIRGLKFFGIIILVVAIIVIVGGLWAKFMDFINPPKQSPSQNKPSQNAVRQNNTPKTVESEQTIIEPKRKVIITIDGTIIEAHVTLRNAPIAKTTETFWCALNTIKYNLTQDITHLLGDDIVTSSTYQGSHVKIEVIIKDVMPDTIKKYHCNTILNVRGKFDPKKLQFVCIAGWGVYDTWGCVYDGKYQRLSGSISDTEARIIAQNE